MSRELNQSILTFVNQNLHANYSSVEVELDMPRLTSWRNVEGFKVKVFKEAVEEARMRAARHAFMTSRPASADAAGA